MWIVFKDINFFRSHISEGKFFDPWSLLYLVFRSWGEEKLANKSRKGQAMRKTKTDSYSRSQVSKEFLNDGIINCSKCFCKGPVRWNWELICLYGPEIPLPYSETSAVLACWNYFYPLRQTSAKVLGPQWHQINQANEINKAKGLKLNWLLNQERRAGPWAKHKKYGCLLKWKIKLRSKAC